MFEEEVSTIDVVFNAVQKFTNKCICSVHLSLSSKTTASKCPALVYLELLPSAMLVLLGLSVLFWVRVGQDGANGKCRAWFSEGRETNRQGSVRRWQRVGSTSAEGRGGAKPKSEFLNTGRNLLIPLKHGDGK